MDTTMQLCSYKRSLYLGSRPQPAAAAAILARAHKKRSATWCTESRPTTSNRLTCGTAAGRWDMPWSHICLQRAAWRAHA